MATYGVLVEKEDGVYTAWAPVINGGYGYGPTPAAAMEHLAQNIKALLPDEPAWSVEVLEERHIQSVQAHLLEITEGKRPRIRQQRLGSLSDIADALGVTRQTVWNWTQRYGDFPIPLAQTSAGPFWSLDEVKRWHTARKKRRRAG
jgi:predicted DNA-binding transcriptional regulator AlpA